MKCLSYFLIVAAVISLSLSGCQQSGTGTETATDTVVGDQANSDSAVASTTEEEGQYRFADPSTTVTEFLNALRAGDEDKSTRMLTAKAREETEKMDLSVRPPGSPSAQFTVGEVEYVGDRDGAHVVSTWTDKNRQGIVETHEIIWILRRDGAGWGIAGMATRLFEDQMPLVFNFEKPEEMVETRKQAEVEMARRLQTENRQALAPERTEASGFQR